MRPSQDWEPRGRTGRSAAGPGRGGQQGNKYNGRTSPGEGGGRDPWAGVVALGGN